MKKILSMMLVVMMLVGMLPMNAIHSHAAELSETLTLAGSTGTVSGDSISWSSGSLSFTANKNTSSTAIRTTDTDHFRLYVGFSATLNCSAGNITKIVMTSTGTSYAIAPTGKDGSVGTVSGTTITIVPKESSNTYTIPSISKQTRIKTIEVTYEVAESGGCAHTNTVTVEAVAATCTTPGFTAGVQCVDCQVYTEGHEVIAATGHNYGDWTVTIAATCTTVGEESSTCANCGDTKTQEVAMLNHTFVDGVCSCGAKEPAGFVLTDLKDITETDKVIITATKTGTYAGTYAMSNDNGTSSAPAAVAVTIEGDILIANDVSNLQWNIVKDGDDLIFYPADTTDTWLYCTGTNNGVRVGTNTSSAFVLDASGYLKHVGTSRYLGVYNAQDWRCYTTSTATNIANQTFAFYVMKEASSEEPDVPSCTHENTTTTTVDASCTTAGSTTVTCDDCGETVSTEKIDALGHSYGEPTVINPTCTEAGSSTATCSACGDVATETIPATGHSYVDGVCSACGNERVDLSGRYYIAAQRTAAGSKVYYMTNALTTTSTKRYSAVATELTEVPAAINTPETDKVFVLVDNGDGTYKIYAEGIEGDAKYLGWTSGNSGALVTEENAKVLSLAYNEDGSVKITFDTRKLTLNNTTGNDYFAWYGSDQANVYLIPVSEACTHENTTTETVDATCTTAGSVTVTCDDCGETVSTEEVAALGHTEVIDAAVAADCVNSGLTEGKHCSVCNEVIVAQEEVAALGHSYVAETTPADCQNDGKTVYTCSGCGDSYEEVIPAGHSIEYVAAVIPANCQETGHDEYWYCAGCDAYFGDAEGSYQVNPAWINYTGEHVRPEGVAVCAVVPCVLCGEDSYGEPCDRGDAPVCQDATCVNCGETVYGWGCNYNTGDEEVPLPLCQPGDCVYCGTHYEKLYDCENGAWSPCLDGECAYGCGKQYPATADHTVTVCEGGLCEMCWNTFEGVGHSYDAVVTPPTATKEGFTTHTCSGCGDSYVDSTVPAVGIGELKFKSAALVLENNLTIKFYADGNLFIEDAYTAPYAVFTVGKKTQKVTEYQIIDGNYVFACTNIAPSQMGDTVYASLCADLNGEACTSSMEYGVANYCYGMLGKTDNAKLRTLLVDLLNYGAAAQKYAWYNDKTPCNAALTEEQKAWGTNGDPVLGSVLNTKYATVENAKATWKAAMLVLENAVTMRFRFAAESTEGLSVKVEMGGQTYTITSFEADPDNAGQYYATFNGTVARQMRETVLVTVYEGDTAVSNTLSYSIESYACGMQNVARVGELVKAMMKYGDSAAAYLN